MHAGAEHQSVLTTTEVHREVISDLHGCSDAIGIFVSGGVVPRISAESIRLDIDMLISDLEGRDLNPMISDGVRTLQKMLDMFEWWDGDPQMRESLVHEIASVFSGEHPTRRYLR
jgi:hypothetical protein